MPKIARLVAVFVLLVGAALAAYAYQGVQRHAEDVARLRYERSISLFADQFREYIRLQGVAATSFAGLVTAAPDLDQAAFERFGTRVAPAYPSLVAVNWFPRTAPDGIAGVEAVLAEAGAPRPYVRDAEGERLDAAALDRDVFPVLLSTPLEANRSLLGFDVFSSPLRRPALEYAGDSGQIVASEPVRLVQLPEQRGTNLYVPVYAGHPREIEARRDALRGYISVAFRLDMLVRDAFPQAPRLFHIHLFDADAADGQRHLGSVAPRGVAGPVAEPDESLIGRADLDSRSVAWGQRHWILVFEPAPGAVTSAPDARAAFEALLILLLSLALAAYVLSQDKARRAVMLANRKLSEAAEEKDLLFKEIHHRIKNNLQIVASLLQIQALQFDDEKVRAAFRDTQGRLESIGMIHNLLYRTDAVGRVELHVYLGRLADALAESFGAEARGIDIALDLQPVTVEMELAVPVALLATEVLTNAFKHAFPSGAGGRIAIALSAGEGEISLTVRDNGCGIAADAAGGGLGQTLIRGLTAQLGGRFSFADEGGTVFRLTLPAQDAKAPEPGGLRGFAGTTMD